jgi:O-antigen/teichoic acid export membrane protein
MSALLLKMKRWLPEGAFARNVAVLAGGTAFAQALVVLTSPLLTRLYAPQDFGALMVYTSVLAVVMVLAALLYEMAIPLPEDEETATNLLGLSLLCVTLVSVLTALAVWAFGDWFAHRMNVPELRPWLWLLPASLFGGGVYLVLNSWALRKKAFTPIAHTKFTQSLALTATQIGLGFGKIGLAGLVIGDAIGRMAGSGTLARRGGGVRREVFSQVTWDGMKGVAVRYRRFPLLTGPATLLNYLGLQVPVLLLTLLYGPHVVGWYALGQRVFGLPVQVIGSAVTSVYFSEAARMAQEEPGRLPTLFWQTIRKLFWIGLPFLVVAVVAAPWAFSLVFGREWEEAGVYVRALAGMFLFQFLAQGISSTLVVLERQDLLLLREGVRIGLLTCALLLSQWLDASAFGAIVLFSAAGALAYVGYTAFAWLAIRRFVRQRTEATAGQEG